MYIDIVEERDAPKKINKKMWDGSNWVDTSWIQIKSDIKLEKWLREHYGDPKYLTNWWRTHNHVTMNDKIYVHWNLCK